MPILFHENGNCKTYKLEKAEKKIPYKERILQSAKSRLGEGAELYNMRGGIIIGYLPNATKENPMAALVDACGVQVQFNPDTLFTGFKPKLFRPKGAFIIFDGH